jgi:ABC-2 type transport system permease protein
VKAYWKLTAAGLKAFVRDRSALFWSFFFPLFFLVLFGSFFGRQGGGGGFRVSVGLVLPDASPASAWVPGVFRKVPVFELHQGTLAAEMRELREGHRRVVVVFPADFAARLQAREPAAVAIHYDPSQQQTAQAALGAVRQVLDGIDRQASGRTPLLQVRETALPPAGDASARRPQAIDFLLPGILGMMLMQLGLFTAIPIINMREKGILKRLRATSLPRWALVGSQVTQRLVIGLVQTLILVGLGTALFHFHVVGSWLALAGLAVFGILTFIALGAVLASIAKTQESGAPLVQLVNVPMMFLSGLFFPPEMMPRYLQPVSDALPATHLADALRQVTVAAPPAYAMTTDLAVMGAWLVGSLLLAARLFRWE